MLISGGNHSWDKKEIYEYMDNSDRILRPANYPEGVCGKGYTILEDLLFFQVTFHLS